MRSEYLNQRDLQRGDLTMHEDSSQIQLHLEPYIHVGPVNRRTPP